MVLNLTVKRMQSGRERMAVASLVATAKEWHGLRAAFAKDAIPGKIYLECVMNDRLIDLLKSTPGIIRSINGVVQKSIVDPHENVQLLEYKNARMNFWAGQWVVLTRGAYKGDVAMVSQCRSNEVDVFVVPRLSDKQNGPRRKRKRTEPRPEARLFKPEHWILDKVLDEGNEHYTAGACYFEHGLLARTIGYNSLSSQMLGMPYTHYCMFMASGHELVKESEMPRPLEWSFKPGDEVYDISERRGGRIKLVQCLYAEVEYSAVEFTEIRRTPWSRIRKMFEIGSYVKAVSGANAGLEGWITEFDNDVVTVQGHMGGGMGSFQVHINFLDSSEPEHRMTKRAEESSVMWGKGEERIPNWKGIKVVIIKQGHAQRTATGTITDVRGTIDDMDSLRVIVSFSDTYNPATGFVVANFAYSEVLDAM